MALFTKTSLNRTREAEMRIGALLVARSKPNGRASTTQVKEEIHKFIPLTPEDHKPSRTRNGEPMYAQIVGNVVSHSPASTSLFKRGYANRTPDGLEITDLGRAHLAKLGY